MDSQHGQIPDLTTGTTASVVCDHSSATESSLSPKPNRRASAPAEVFRHRQVAPKAPLLVSRQRALTTGIGSPLYVLPESESALLFMTQDTGRKSLSGTRHSPEQEASFRSPIDRGSVTRLSDPRIKADMLPPDPPWLSLDSPQPGWRTIDFDKDQNEPMSVQRVE
jgi:hypothetical protein